MLEVIKRKFRELNSIRKVWFLVNTSGFPMDDKTWNRMWSFAAESNPDICVPNDLPEISVPKAPLKMSQSLSVVTRVLLVQKYLNQLQYNYTGTQFFNVKKRIFISSLMRQARVIISESLPIKCLEAVLVAIYLTNDTKQLNRLPVSFKTSTSQRVFRHVVLALHHEGQYGCIGLSRSPQLMFKPLIFHTLSDLLMNFVQNYEQEGHSMMYIKLGECVPHDINSTQPLSWNFKKLNVVGMSAEEMRKGLDKAARELRQSNSGWLGYNCGNNLKEEFSKLTKLKLPSIKVINKVSSMDASQPQNCHEKNPFIDFNLHEGCRRKSNVMGDVNKDDIKVNSFDGGSGNDTINRVRKVKNNNIKGNIKLINVFENGYKLKSLQKDSIQRHNNKIPPGLASITLVSKNTVDSKNKRRNKTQKKKKKIN